MSRTLAALTALALLLTGCTDDPEPRFADPTSDPPTSEPATTEPPTTPPTQDPEPLTPEDTVRAWVEAFNVLLTTGRREEFARLSTADCPQCRQLSDSIGEMYNRGGSTRTKGWIVRNVAKRPTFTSEAGGKVVASIAATRGVTVGEEGDEPVVDPPDKFIVELTLRSEDGRWLVGEMAFLS